MNSHVSVILPYFNRSDTLHEAVESVLNQTHRELTLYLIDDGSTDGSPQVAKRIQDGRIKHVQLLANRGVCVARNAGMAAVRSSLIAFMDSDDAWLPLKLESQIMVLRLHQAGGERLAIVGCGWRQEGDSFAEGRSFPTGPFERKSILRGVAGTGTPMLLVDTNMAARGAAFDPSFPALVERDFILSCLANGSVLRVLPEVLVQVRRGRADHVANPARASVAWERYIDKYKAEFASDEDLRSWYHYRAAREHLIARRATRAAAHLSEALSRHRLRRAVHLALGLVLGAKGLALAGKALPL
jgi:glycosyltransferase involved in cell wall biosynthesis